VTYLDWRTQRRLGGLAKRLWVYLEAEKYKSVGDGRESTYIILGEKAYTALSVNNARERDRRLALKRAGEKIMSVDGRYESVVVERNPVGRLAPALSTIAGVEARQAACSDVVQIQASCLADRDARNQKRERRIAHDRCRLSHRPGLGVMWTPNPGGAPILTPLPCARSERGPSARGFTRKQQSRQHVPGS